MFVSWLVSFFLSRFLALLLFFHSVYYKFIFSIRFLRLATMAFFSLRESPLIHIVLLYVKSSATTQNQAKGFGINVKQHGTALASTAAAAATAATQKS